MPNFNRIQLIGHVGQQPEIKQFDTAGKTGGSSEQKEIASFSLATSESYTKRDGERITNTYWHRIVVMSPHLIKIVRDYVGKGSTLLVEGALKPREYTDKEGNKRTIAEIVLTPFQGNIVLLDKKEKSEDYQKPVEKPKSKDDYSDELDDNIPF